MNTIANIFRKKHILPVACLVVADGLVFGATNPDTAPSLLLIAAFLLYMLTSYYVLKGLLTLPALYGIQIRHKQRLLRTLTALSGFIVALQSIGQLSTRDVLVLSLLTGLFYLYLAYAKSLRGSLQTKSM